MHSEQFTPKAAVCLCLSGQLPFCPPWADSEQKLSRFCSLSVHQHRPESMRTNFTFDGTGCP